MDRPASTLIDRYPHRVGGHCGSGALRDLMEWAGLGWDGPPSEGLVFTLGGALDLAYMRSPELSPTIYLVGRGPDLEIDLPTRLGGTSVKRCTDDPLEGWDWVRSEIVAGQPVMAWSDISELPYLRVRLQMSRHDIVIVGFDDDQQTAYVVDNDRADVQSVPYDALARARSSTAFPEPTRHTIYEISWPQILPALGDTAADAFRRDYQTMASSTGPSLATPAENAVSGRGLGAVTAFVDDVESWADSLDVEQLDGNLFALFAFIEKAGTGGGLFRRLLAEGSAEIARATDDHATAMLAAAAAQCAAAWSRVATNAVDRDASVHARASEVVGSAKALVGLETALVEQLLVASDSLRMLGAKA